MTATSRTCSQAKKVLHFRAYYLQQDIVDAWLIVEVLLTASFQKANEDQGHEWINPCHIASQPESFYYTQPTPF